MDKKAYYSAGYKAAQKKLEAMKSAPAFYYELEDWAAKLADMIDDTTLTEVTDVRMDYIERGSGNNGFDTGTEIDEQMRAIQGSIATTITKLKAFSKLIGSTNH